MFKDTYYKHPFEFFQALEKAWEKTFYSERWSEIVNKYQDIPNGNFGSFVAMYLYNSSRDFLKSELSNPNFKTFNYKYQDRGQSSRNIYSLKNNTSNTDFYFKNFINFKKAMRSIINSAQTLNLKPVQKQSLKALEEIVFNFKNYDEIGQTMFDDDVIVGAVNSRLKSILNKIAKPMLEPYGITPDIFSDPNWKTKHQNLPANIVDQIINQFNTTSKAGGTEKRKYTHAFKLFADEHYTPEEIAKFTENSSKITADKVQNSINSNLKHNEKFIRLADSILREFGFPISFEDIEWADYIKAGKQLKATQDSRSQIKQYAENFISEVKRIINQ